MKLASTLVCCWSLILGAGFAVGACAHTQKSGASEVEIVTYDAEYGEQTLSRVQLKLPWELQNPTSEPAAVDAIHWTLTIPEEAEQSGTFEPKVTASGSGSASGTLVVDATLSASNEAFEVREKKAALRYYLSASFVVSTPDLTEDFEAEWYGDIFPSKRPTVSLKPHAVRYGSNADFEFTLVITNPNPFDVKAEALDYVIKVEGVTLASGTVAEGRKLGRGTDTQFDISRQVDRQTFPTLARKVQSSKSLSYSLESTLKAGGLELKRSLKGEITFSR